MITPRSWSMRSETIFLRDVLRNAANWAAKLMLLSADSLTFARALAVGKNYGDVMGKKAGTSASTAVTEGCSSYPRPRMRLPQERSIAATDSSGSCDFHPPAVAERMNGLS